MDARFSIDVDAATSVVRITMAGFSDQSAIAHVIAARNAVHHELRCAPNQHVTLVDIVDMNIQSRDAVDAFKEVLSDPAVMSRAIAFVTSRSLARSQALRAAAGREASFFVSHDEAERWLRGATIRSPGDHVSPASGMHALAAASNRILPRSASVAAHHR